MDNSNLSEKAYWDQYWREGTTFLEIKKGQSDFIDEILFYFDKYLPANRNFKILEIGGGSGRYLVYMHKQFGYEVHCLDYSETGCELTRKNFASMNIGGIVHHGNLFSDSLNLPQFDIVYSLGFIEHFQDLDDVISRHLSLLKPGGILLIGTPNFGGINGFFLKHLSPKFLSMHVLSTMDIRRWAFFEKKTGLKVLFKGYIGGFEPGTFWRCEQYTLVNYFLKFTAKLLVRIFSCRFKTLRRLNSKYISGYILGIYQKGP